MRHKGTIYPEITELPDNAMYVSEYAMSLTPPMKVGAVYMKYKRFYNIPTGKRRTGARKPNWSDPGYIIRSYKKTNYVIPTC